MRFRLVEAPVREWPPSTEILDAFAKQKSLKQQKDFLAKHILPQPKFRNLFGIRQIIIHSIMIAGLDPKKNKFLDFVCKIPFKMSDAPTYQPKMQYVYDSFNNKKLAINSTSLLPVLLNPSLWSRSLEDFKYTLNAFNLFSQPKLYKAYLKDTEKTAQVSISQFMNGNVIKDAGQDGREGDTIYNKIEEWAENNEYSVDEIEANKKRAEEKEKNKDSSNKNSKYVLEDVIPEPWEYATLKKYVETAFKHKDIIKPKSDKETYLNKLYVALEYPNLLTADYLKEIQSTPNKVLNKSVDSISESDVKSFGNPTQKPDVPIPLRVIEDGKSNAALSGIFVFHKFIPLTNSNITTLKQQSAKYKRDMELKTFVMSNDKTIEKLKGLISVLDQIG